MKIDVYSVTFGVGKRDVKLQNIFYNKFYNYVELSSYSLAAPHGVQGLHMELRVVTDSQDHLDLTKKLIIIYKF